MAKETGKSWPDLLDRAPKWLGFGLLAALLALISVSLFCLDQPVKIGIIGEFGPVPGVDLKLSETDEQIVQSLSTDELIGLASDFRGSIRQCQVSEQVAFRHENLFSLGLIAVVARECGDEGKPFSAQATTTGKRVIEAVFAAVDAGF